MEKAMVLLGLGLELRYCLGNEVLEVFLYC